MNPKVSIIILNWNGREDTLECLESLRKIEYDNYEIYVVDNNSSGNDVEVIKEKYGEFVKQIIVNESNLGFSGGNNIGINIALKNNADYVLLLNNDTIVEPNFLSEIISKQSDIPGIGILTPMIKYFSAPNKIWSAGGNISKLRGSGFSFGMNQPDHIYMKDRYCTFASGCCLLIKNEVLNKIGLLDEKYFLYVEDTDFCQRAVDAGFKILYVGSSIIYHKVNSSTTSTKYSAALPLYYTSRNRFYFAKKLLGNYYYPFFVYMFVTSIIKILLANTSDRKTMVLYFKKAFRDFSAGNMGMMPEIQIKPTLNNW